MRLVTTRVSAVLVLLLSAAALRAQQAPSPAVTAVPRLVRVTGAFFPANGLAPAPVEIVTLAIYAEETGGTPLWQETQNVTVDANGRYTVLLGSTYTEGLPLDVFASGEARWLGRRFERPGEGEQPRVLLVSVPYALKAGDADTLGGRPSSAYVLVDPGATADTGPAGTGAAAKTGTASASDGPALADGTANFIGKFVSGTELGNSSLFNSGSSVGLNTTTPFDALHVRFTNTTGAFAGYAVQNLGNTATSYSGMLFYDQNGALGQFQGFNNGTHEYRINNIAAGGSINFMIGGSSKFQVASSGNIGIGTTNPQYLLDVANRVRVRQGPGSTNTAGIWLYQTTPASDQAFVGMKGDTEVGIWGNTGATWGVVMDTTSGNVGINGNVGIGTAPVGRKFSVSNGTGIVGVDFSGSIGRIGSFGAGDLKFVSHGFDAITVNGSGYLLPDEDALQLMGDATHRWLAIYSQNGTIQTSDARLKKSITDLGYGLSQVLRLRPVSFEWKDGSDGRQHLGLLAQEVGAIIPEAIERDKDPAVPLGMNYNSLVPVAIKAIQEQQDAITTIDAENAMLKQENATLGARITALEQALQQLLGQPQDQANPSRVGRSDR